MSDMIFEVPYHQPPKKPTLFQFLGSEKSEKLKAKYVCIKIWFPNQFPVLCFETEDFRINIEESNPLFDSLKGFSEKMASQNQLFCIVINPERDGGFGIASSAEKGTWKKIGRTGFEFEFAVKRTPKAKF